MKAKHVEALIRQDLEREPFLQEFTCVIMTLRAAEQNPEAPWHQVMAILNVDADKLCRDYSPNSHALIRLYWSYKGQDERNPHWEQQLEKMKASTSVA